MLRFDILIVLILIVQIVMCMDWINNNREIRSVLEPYKNALLRIKRNVKNSVNNKRHLELMDDARLFENIYENMGATSTAKSTITDQSKDDMTLVELKAVLNKLLDKLNKLDAIKKRKAEMSTSLSTTLPTTLATPAMTSEVHLEYFYSPKRFLQLKKRKRQEHKMAKREKWSDWTEWSPCSVTCGKGREIRWRHCVEECDDVETEMEEKTCQLPACAPGKIFGIKL